MTQYLCYKAGVGKLLCALAYFASLLLELDV